MNTVVSIYFKEVRMGLKNIQDSKAHNDDYRGLHALIHLHVPEDWDREHREAKVGDDIECFGTGQY